jgi:hypothetical protein
MVEVGTEIEVGSAVEVRKETVGPNQKIIELFESEKNLWLLRGDISERAGVTKKQIGSAFYNFDHKINKEYVLERKESSRGTLYRVCKANDRSCGANKELRRFYKTVRPVLKEAKNLAKQKRGYFSPELVLEQITQLDVLVESAKDKAFYEEAKQLLQGARNLTDRPHYTVSTTSVLNKLILLGRLIEGARVETVHK